MHEFTLYASDQRGNQRNKLYPYRFTVKTVGDLVAAAQYDHVCATYADNLRSNDRFLSADGPWIWTTPTPTIPQPGRHWTTSRPLSLMWRSVRRRAETT